MEVDEGERVVGEVFSFKLSYGGGCCRRCMFFIVCVFEGFRFLGFSFLGFGFLGFSLLLFLGEFDILRE